MEGAELDGGLDEMDTKITSGSRQEQKRRGRMVLYYCTSRKNRKHETLHENNPNHNASCVIYKVLGMDL